MATLSSRDRWRFANPERVKESAERWRKANPEKVRQYQIRCDDKRKAALALRREAFLEKQGDVCAVCGTSDPGTVKGWQLDHDHACCDTKTARSACGNCDRGVLCQTCNQWVVALIEKHPERVVSALEYLNLTYDDLVRRY